MTAYGDTARLLHAAREGDRDAFDEIYGRVYEELRDIAHRRLAGYRPGETLNTTALVHEAYLRLAPGAALEVRDRAHLLALGSRAMRFILINHAEARLARKRGGGMIAVPIDQVQIPTDTESAEMLSLNEALEQLAGFSERLARLVEYRFFGGLSYDEIAEVTGVSVPTIKRDWVRARGWLYQFMQSGLV